MCKQRLLLHISFILISVLTMTCGSNRELTGIWQQVPFNEGDKLSETPIALYELHLGQYGNRITGLSIRYQKPKADFLSTFDGSDRCDCHYIVQGKNDDQVAFTLLQMQETYSVSGVASCQINTLECKRIFLLTLEDDELVGEMWCENKDELMDDPQLAYWHEVIAVRFQRSTGIPTKECQPVMSE